MRKICRRGQRTSNWYAELDHFSLLFFITETATTYVKIYNARAGPLFCYLTFRLVTFSLPFPLWFTFPTVQPGYDNKVRSYITIFFV